MDQVLDLDWRDGWCHIDGERVAQVFHYQHCDGGPGWVATINYARINDACYPTALDAMAAVEGALMATVHGE